MFLLLLLHKRVFFKDFSYLKAIKGVFFNLGASVFSSDGLMLKYIWDSWTSWLLPPQVLQAGSESSFIAGSGPRGPWPAGRRTSS